MATVESLFAADRITLGSTDLHISPLGIGTWQWGDRMVWNYGKGEFSNEDIQTGFKASLASGINFFDTAEVYGRGQSETLLGQFVHDAQVSPSVGNELVIATKFMPYPWRLSR